MAKTLTAAAVRTLRPTSQRQEIKDGAAQGLYLTIQSTGHKSWCLRFRRPDGRPGKFVLGPVDLSGQEVTGEPIIGQALTLASARQLATQVMRDRAMGLDVIGNRKVEKMRMRTQHQERSQNNFVECVRAFVAGHAKPKTRDWQRTSKLLGLTPEGEIIPRGLCDRWGDRPIMEINSHDIYNTVDECRRIGVPGLTSKTDGPSESRARHVHAALSTFFSWCVRHRRIESNPVASVHRPDGPPPRDRVLNDAEIQKFWKACDSVGEPFGSIFRLLLLTGQRLREVAGMRRSEINVDIWTLPSTRSKNRRAHTVPLSRQVQDIIARQPNLGTDLLFTTTSTTAVSGWSKTKARLDRIIGDGVPPWTLHDLRRTAVTHMNELGIAPHVIEHVVNHISGSRNSVAGVYNRSELLVERRAALERWSSHIEHLVAGTRGTTVVPLRRA